MPLLASGHLWKIWCFSWLSAGSACVVTLTASNQDPVAGISDVMWWTKMAPKLSLSPGSGLSWLTQLKASVMTLYLPFKYVSSTLYFASLSSKCSG